MLHTVLRLYNAQIANSSSTKTILGTGHIYKNTLISDFELVKPKVET